MTEMLSFVDFKIFNKEIRKIQDRILKEILKENDEKIQLRFEELKLCLSEQFWIRNTKLERKQ